MSLLVFNSLYSFWTVAVKVLSGSALDRLTIRAAIRFGFIGGWEGTGGLAASQLSK